MDECGRESDMTGASATTVTSRVDSADLAAKTLCFVTDDTLPQLAEAFE